MALLASDNPTIPIFTYKAVVFELVLAVYVKFVQYTPTLSISPPSRNQPTSTPNL